MNVWLVVVLVLLGVGLLGCAMFAWIRLLIRWADSHIELHERRTRYFGGRRG